MFSKKVGPSVKIVLVYMSAIPLFISCGGGGGGGSSTPTTSTVAITSDNAVPVASEILTSGSLLSESAQGTGENLTGAVSTDQAKGLGIVDVVFSQMKNIQQNEADLLGDSSATGVMQNGTMQCDLGGSVSATVNDRDNSGTLSTGDSISMTFTNCSMSADGGVGTMNGRMSMEIHSISGDLVNSGSFDVGVTMTSMVMNLPEVSATLSGDMRLQMTFSGSSLNFTASGTRLSYSEANRARTLAHYSLYLSTPNAMATWTYRYRGSLQSSQVLGGTVSFQSMADLTGSSTDFPSAGQIEVTGTKPEGAENNSSLYMTVLNNTTVQLDIDANGDGVYEDTQMVAWSQLIL